MAATAKLFQNGQSQAVRLPKEFRFENNQKEVSIKKLGNLIILFSDDKNRWENWFQALDHFSDDFVMEVDELALDKREELFQ